MANVRKSLTQNTEGNLFGDFTCINCGVGRHYARDIFGATGVYTFVNKHPRDDVEQLAAQQVLLDCPVGLTGMRVKNGLQPVWDEFYWA